MTPAELLVLFSSYIITFGILVFIDVADDTSDLTAKAAPKNERAKLYHGAQKSLIDSKDTAWNVATFFGLNQKIN